MSRVQLALNVADIDEAVAFYSELFATAPTKMHPGYANFAVVDPPLKLVLIEDPTQAPGTLNHLGVEVETTNQVTAAQSRLAGAGLSTAIEEQTECCYALQDKVWVHGPGGEPWEIYTVLADAATPAVSLPTEPAADREASGAAASREAATGASSSGGAGSSSSVTDERASGAVASGGAGASGSATEEQATGRVLSGSPARGGSGSDGAGAGGPLADGTASVAPCCASRPDLTGAVAAPA